MMRDGDQPVQPGRQLIDRGGGLRVIGDADPQHRGVAEPERQTGDKADLGDIDRIQPPGRIDAIAHRAAGKDAGADIVSDRIAGEGRKCIDAVRDVVSADRAHGEQIVEGQREITGGHEQRRQRNRSGLGALDRLDDLERVDVAQHVIKHVAGNADDRDADRDAQLVQDLPVAQKRNRPAYWFQHLDLEKAVVRTIPPTAPYPAIRFYHSLHSLAHTSGANVKSAPAVPDPLVAGFAPEWNSLHAE